MSAARDPEDLRHSAAAGDAAAMHELLLRHLPGLERFLARNAGDLIAAKESRSDLAQSVCREVLERLATDRLQFRSEPEFRHWLYEAALFKLRNRHRYYRARKRDAAAERSGAASAPADTTGPGSKVRRREQQERLAAALQLLPEPEREIVRLAHLEGLAHAAIAERLGITESHSRTRLARALAKLGRLVGPEA
ncbi:MAG: sigma-70 family RNA polymerase sigma factor [Planctomycetota bacterium]|nr:MAG: sigma-70 family RNA polymerase sigma factor [Planctomycetota bacterium]